MLRGLRQAHSLNFLCLEPFMGFPLKRTKCPCRYVHVCFVACGRFHGGDSFSLLSCPWWFVSVLEFRFQQLSLLVSCVCAGVGVGGSASVWACVCMCVCASLLSSTQCPTLRFQPSAQPGVLFSLSSLARNNPSALVSHFSPPRETLNALSCARHICCHKKSSCT